MRPLVACVFLVLCGCPKPSSSSDKPAPSGSTSDPIPGATLDLSSILEDAAAAPANSGPQPVTVAPIPSTGPMTVNFEGRVTPLPHAGAVLTDTGLEIFFTDSVTAGCPKKYEPNATSLSFVLPPGPKNGYFAGSTFGVRLAAVSAIARKDSFAIENGWPQITLAAFKPAVGQHVLGSLQETTTSSKVQTHNQSHDDRTYGYAAGGAIDVTICADKRTTPVTQPASPPTGDMHGTIGGVAFTVKSAVAFAVHDTDRGLDSIFSMEFFPDAGVTCKTRTKETESLDIRDFKGATSQWAPLKTNEPGKPEHDLKTINGSRISVDSKSLGSNAWVSFDAISFKAGDTVTGAAAVVTSDKDPTKAVNVGGHFSATVCY